MATKTTRVRAESEPRRTAAAHTAADGHQAQTRPAPRGTLAEHIAQTPRMLAQRRQIGTTFGKAEEVAQLHGNTRDVVQRVNIPVGFDGSPTQSMFAGAADDLTTVGLGNCIAIVAYHTAAPSLGAVMRHYDTVNAFAGMVHDPVSGGNALTFNAAAIAGIAANTAAQLVLNVPAAAGNVGFAVAVGGVWANVDPGTARWQSRFNLINAIVAATGVEPEMAGATANFDVATSTLS
jgi:hypothetical protein